MFVGESVRIFSQNGLLNRDFIGNLHPGELSATYEQADNCTATSCEGVGTFWMVANNRTLSLMDYFWCRAFHNGRHEDSNPAFIVDVLYPECGNKTLEIASKPISNVTTTKMTPSLNTPSNLYSRSNPTAATNKGSQNTFIWSLGLSILCVLCACLCECNV